MNDNAEPFPLGIRSVEIDMLSLMRRHSGDRIYGKTADKRVGTDAFCSSGQHRGKVARSYSPGGDIAEGVTDLTSL